MKPRPHANSQTLSELMAMAEDFAQFSLRNGRQIPPTLLAATKRGPLFFTPAALQDDRSKDDFADTARLICIAYEVPAAVMILGSWMKMAAEGEKLNPDERPSEAMDRHEVVMVTARRPGLRNGRSSKSSGQMRVVSSDSPNGKGCRWTSSKGDSWACCRQSRRSPRSSRSPG